MGVPVVLHQQFELSKPAHELWVEGRLLEELGIPDDGRTLVEIIGGEIVVSPGPLFHHARIVTDIQTAFTLKQAPAPDYPWRCVQTMDFNLQRVGDGYIPDLIVLPTSVYEDPSVASAPHLTAKQIGMAVEVTSRWTAVDDREPTRQRERPTKWNGYAHEEVEFYLLVDRAPNRAMVTLFTEPNPARGIYLGEKSWAFGETIALPEPFGVEIPTTYWQPWEDQRK